VAKLLAYASGWPSSVMGRSIKIAGVHVPLLAGFGHRMVKFSFKVLWLTPSGRPHGSDATSSSRKGYTLGWHFNSTVFALLNAGVRFYDCRCRTNIAAVWLCGGGADCFIGKPIRIFGSLAGWRFHTGGFVKLPRWGADVGLSNLGGIFNLVWSSVLPWVYFGSVHLLSKGIASEYWIAWK